MKTARRRGEGETSRRSFLPPPANGKRPPKSRRLTAGGFRVRAVKNKWRSRLAARVQLR